jgi:tRNA (guanine37-N1)-methyltransferase
MVKRAQEKQLIEVVLVDFRLYALDKHKTTDDRPFGGGPGMVLKPEPIVTAVEKIITQHPEAKIIMLSPQGKPYSQKIAEELASPSEAQLDRDIILLCGRYEGFDERIFEILKPIEISIGDYVLSGGEVPAMVLIDSIMRLLPGALGCAESVKEDSFSDGVLDHPHYTRPPEYRGLKVPEVLISGDHEKIREWRLQKAIEKTKKNRNDLL